jgi:endoglucanase
MGFKEAMPRRLIPLACVLFSAVLAAPVALAASAHTAHKAPKRHRAAHPAPRRARVSASACLPGNYSAPRDPANPLMVRDGGGANPLAGAPLFIDGPRHGTAAQAIVRLLGMNPTSFSDDTSWAQFDYRLHHGALAHRLATHPRLVRQVAMLSKIASQPEENRFSRYSAGGGPGKVLQQVRQFFCYNLKADPGSVPVLTTYFLYQAGYCETKSEILAHRATFQRQVREFAEGIGRHPAIVLMELDAIGSSSCMSRNGALPYWEQDISYEIGQVAALPHVAAYIEGGYADSSGPAYTARALNAVGVRRIQGFFTNDTHNDWTIKEIRWGERVSELTHGTHFIVGTATNGRGPLLNPHPATQGIEDLCNAPGRGIGPRPTTSTGFPRVDGFLWITEPGESAGKCHDNGPPSGTFWPARAVGMAARAQGKLGPGYARDPW